jgi:hypothetical protein
VQAPATQSSLLPQSAADTHGPHTPPWQIWPGAQSDRPTQPVHTPAEQMCPPVHTRPHPPQLLLSFMMSISHPSNGLLLQLR